jgi:hypothetical protein
MIAKVRDIYITLAPLYGAGEHAPDNPLVRACYDRLKAELWQQFQTLRQSVDVTFTAFDPYATVGEMFADLTRSQLCVYTVADLPIDHPLRQLAPNAQSYNSVFRAVHDGLAHWSGRNPFHALGEFRAFQAHARLLSPLAQWAVATETLGQQAYLRYGSTPGEFAPQKALLLPRRLVDLATELR